jgi:hypothetical protein
MRCWSSSSALRTFAESQWQAIADLLEGIMQDDRVFSVDERFARFNDQGNVLHACPGRTLAHAATAVMFECGATRAWSTGDAAEVIRNAQSRLATEGWDATRPALSFTVRCVSSSVSLNE